MLAQAGADVAVGYRSRGAEADETLAGVRRFRRPAIGVTGDLGDPAAAGRAVDDAVQGLGGLELLIVNHGIWPSEEVPDRKSTRLNSSHLVISYAVFCLKKKKK